MVISQGPSGSALLQALEGRRSPSARSALFLAVGVSVAVHLGAGLYMAHLRVKPIPAPPLDISATSIGIVRLPKAADVPAPDIKLKVRRSVVVSDAPAPDKELPIPAPPGPTAADAGAGSGDSQVYLDGGPDRDLTPEPIPPKVIGKPQWVTRPTGAELARHYPGRAERLGRSGAATLTCTVNAVGTVRECVVISETPGGFGFGEAALKLSRYFRMQPQTEDGQPVDGGVVSIPLKFQIE